jgi:ABC-type multidrug transport system ATPase subunit
MIEVRSLTKVYGESRAISDLNFTVNKGEVVGFLGPNGAGKSTTMKIITGFMAPSSGSATVCGFDVFESPLEVKKTHWLFARNPSGVHGHVCEGLSSIRGQTQRTQRPRGHSRGEPSH